MKRCIFGLCALGLWVGGSVPADAAWNNVFQPTLFGVFRRPTTTNYYTPPVVVQSSPVVVQSAPVMAQSPCCTPAPQPACSTSYTQRCYYQPVTTYQSQSYYEPVTTYQTSYYYEPVTSYRYSFYYDPCTCNYKQVATPVTSYQLRAQNCPVQSWVQRCASVPVTSYQKACYWQPQTTCCTTTPGAPVAMPPVQQPASPPGVYEQKSTPPPPVINEQKNGSQLYDRYYPPPTPTPTPSTSFEKPQPQWNAVPQATPTSPAAAPPPPAVKLDKIVFGPDATVDGQVVHTDNTPRASAKVLFVNAEQPANQQFITANDAGRFQVSLASGSWLVYVHTTEGTPLFHSRIEVTDQNMTPLTLVNR